MLKRFISYMTKPDNMLRYYGNYYVEVASYEVPSFHRTKDDRIFKYNYRRVKQNRYGKWELQTEWLGTYEPIQQKAGYRK